MAGLVRGFSGFGSALIYMPLMSAVYGPQVAASTLLLIDSISSLPFTFKVMPQCNWREVTPVSIAGALALPIGVMALVLIDPLVLRWFIAALVLAALAALASGWRYHGRPTVAASLGVGALAGIGGGAVQIGAPPLLIFWLGGSNNAATVRANIMVYFIPQAALSCVMYYFNDLFTAQTINCRCCWGCRSRRPWPPGFFRFTARATRSTAASPMSSSHSPGSSACRCSTDCGKSSP